MVFKSSTSSDPCQLEEENMKYLKLKIFVFGSIYGVLEMRKE
jgi:hypothetical protein